MPVLGAVPTALLAGVVGLTAVRGRHLATASRRVTVGAGVGAVVCLHVLLATAVAALGREGPLARRLLETTLYEPLFSTLLTGTFLTAPTLVTLVGVQYLLVVDRRDPDGSDGDGEAWRSRLASVRVRLGPERRRVRLVTACLSVVVALGGFVLALAGGPGPTRSVVALVPALLFLPLGVADRRGAHSRHLLRAAVVVSPVALVLAVGPVWFSTPLLYAPWGALTAVVGVLAYAAGRGADESRGETGDGTSADDRPPASVDRAE